MHRCLLQRSEAAPFAFEACPDGPAPDGPVEAQVVACAPGAWDRVPARRWPRTPGGVILSRRRGQDSLSLCAGYQPCGVCPPCEAGLLLSCAAPRRPGWNAPGGLAETLALAPEFLATDVPPSPLLPMALALLASAGPLYGALAAAGACPGDAVVLRGDPGPGEIPLRLLLALGMRAVWIDADPDRTPPGVETARDELTAGGLPASRVHLMDARAAPLPADWLPLAPAALSLSLLGPAQPQGGDGVALPDPLLAGELALRRVADLHPHLALDLVAEVVHGRLDLGDGVRVEPLESFAPLMERFVAGRSRRWPVAAVAAAVDTDRG